MKLIKRLELKIYNCIAIKSKLYCLDCIYFDKGFLSEPNNCKKYNKNPSFNKNNIRVTVGEKPNWCKIGNIKGVI
jgi:hypothetical protein